MRRRLFAVLIAAIPFAAAAQAPTVAIEQPWSRAAMAGRNGAVYMTIVAKGAPDRLVSAWSPAAERVEVHESLMDNGVMKMREIKGLAVEPGKPAKLVPGGNHVMLMNGVDGPAWAFPAAGVFGFGIGMFSLVIKRNYLIEQSLWKYFDAPLHFIS